MNGLRESYKESIWPATSCIISLALRDYINFASEKDIEFYQLAMQVCRELPEFETLPLLIKLGCGLAALAAATLLPVLGRATVVLRLRPPPCLHHHAPEGGRETGRAPPGRLGKGPPGGRLPPPHHRRMRHVCCRICSPHHRIHPLLPGLIPAPPDPPSRRRSRGIAEGGGAAGIGGRRWGGFSGRSLEVMRRGGERERGRQAAGPWEREGGEERGA